MTNGSIKEQRFQASGGLLGGGDKGPKSEDTAISLLFPLWKGGQSVRCVSTYVTCFIVERAQNKSSGSLGRFWKGRRKTWVRIGEETNVFKAFLLLLRGNLT